MLIRARIIFQIYFHFVTINGISANALAWLRYLRQTDLFRLGYAIVFITVLTIRTIKVVISVILVVSRLAQLLFSSTVGCV